MLVSPFAFYRGAAMIMASDLAHTPNSGLEVQLCGDAHLSNFGVFASPERRLIFDINDFDETLPGPWEWDLKRLAVSFEVAGRELGWSDADRRAVVMSAVGEYRRFIRRAAERGTMDNWYADLAMDDVLSWFETEAQLGKREVKEAAKDVAKARTRDSSRVFTRLTGEVDGARRIVADAPLIVPIEDLARPGTSLEAIEGSMQTLIWSYRGTLTDEHHPLEEFSYVHAARKVVGVGSVGTRAWVILMRGRDDGDPLFLQAKEAQESVLETFLPRSRYQHHGQRVVVGQRLMQAASDIFLGWQRVFDLDGETRDYYIRQLHDWKGAVDLEGMRVQGAISYAHICGDTLARAHARWGDRIAIASYLGKSEAFDESIADFAHTYADQNERDFNALQAAVASGRVSAEMGL
jgi:uncharacterized protein (DUF2252 family)